MGAPNVEHINPFLMAATSVLEQMCRIQPKIGKPFIKKPEYANATFLIIIGVTGQIKGQVNIALPMEVARDVASKMCMMELPEFNEIAESALSELGNMILGNAATILATKGIKIDITPPTLCRGSVTLTNMYAQSICVPIGYEEDKIIEMNIALKEA